MTTPSITSRWTRHIVYRSERLRTTWTLRLAVFAFVVLVLWSTSSWWTEAIGRSLVCEANRAPSDAILVENFDQDYRLFQRAARLRQAGLAARVLVPVSTDSGTQKPNEIALGVVELMATISRVGPIQIVPTREIEPITLNTARDVRRFLEREQIRSVIVVTPLFRSRRSALVYGATLGRAGITVRLEPVGGAREIRAWTQSWHGIQAVAEQWLKLQYYRLYVLPFRSSPREPAAGS